LATLALALALGACETDSVVSRPFGFELAARSAHFCEEICPRLRACERSEVCTAEPCDPARPGASCEEDCVAALAALESLGDTCTGVSEGIHVCYAALGCEVLAHAENACSFDGALWSACRGTEIIDLGWIHQSAQQPVVCAVGDGHSTDSGGGDPSEPWVYCEIEGTECSDGHDRRASCTREGDERYCTCLREGEEARRIVAPADGGCGDVGRHDFGCGWILP
jgi:hypothetical protein